MNMITIICALISTLEPHSALNHVHAKFAKSKYAAGSRSLQAVGACADVSL